MTENTAQPTQHDAPPSPGAALLDELRDVIARFVIPPHHHALDATALWVAATHLQAAWQHAPCLAVVGPAKRCGKSRLLDMLTETVHAPVITVNSTPAAVFRSITEEPPTLLVDEADTLFGTPRMAERNEEMRGLLNAGHQRGRYVLRVIGNDHTPHHFPTFAMTALAGIGELPDTVMDRSIVIRMRRRAYGERVSPYRTRRDSSRLRAIRDRVAAWARPLTAHALGLEPQMPVEDRAADTWEPLIIVADLAGGPWAARARAACARMVADEARAEADHPDNARLLADVRRVFATAGDPDCFSTDQLLFALNSAPEAPWGEHTRTGLTARALAGLLRDYDIRSGNVRMPDHTQRKGYARAKFTDAWRRYCPTVHPLDATAPTT
ncbi:DUF3631 domain-containing protein [Streptomyces sp. 3MP-14]|uniref:DUF3631 domain-containing protein n=1 Tax=Streptomyces mimosae TaxID=2586635 RepID=A0A5N6A1C1_9ACTN|nr:MULTISPECIES: DUF3631 domain-containing protein [Streptomyces]KAB8161799.1 DUF3631 domain-containing protein [Streptomyces mimosae]KAB8174933.1 DUF3631 domain-containing protein [Streptomyces sp. 3MP-14]